MTQAAIDTRIPGVEQQPFDPQAWLDKARQERALGAAAPQRTALTPEPPTPTTRAFDPDAWLQQTRASRLRMQERRPKPIAPELERVPEPRVEPRPARPPTAPLGFEEVLGIPEEQLPLPPEAPPRPPVEPRAPIVPEPLPVPVEETFEEVGILGPKKPDEPTPRLAQLVKPKGIPTVEQLIARRPRTTPEAAQRAKRLLGGIAADVPVLGMQRASQMAGIPLPKDFTERSIAERSYRAFNQGRAGFDRDVEMMQAARSTKDVFRGVYSKQQAEEAMERDVLKGLGPVGKSLLKTSAIAGGMSKGFEGGLVGATAGGLIGLAAAGITAGPDPTDAVTVPAAVRTGIAIGQKLGGAARWYGQGVGSLYRDMRLQDVSHDTARVIAQIGGVPYAAIEYMEQLVPIAKLIPGGKQAAKKAVRQTTRQVMARLVKQYGQRVLSESSEEFWQEVSNEVFTEWAKRIEGLAKKGKWKTGAKILTKAARAFGEAIVPMMILGAGSVAITAPAEIRALHEREAPEAPPEVAPPPTPVPAPPAEVAVPAVPAAPPPVAEVAPVPAVAPAVPEVAPEVAPAPPVAAPLAPEVEVVAPEAPPTPAELPPEAPPVAKRDITPAEVEKPVVPPVVPPDAEVTAEAGQIRGENIAGSFGTYSEAGKRYKKQVGATGSPLDLLLKFAKEVPEFADDPTFTVRDGKLQFRDTYEFRFNPSVFGLDAAALTEEQSVTVDMDSLRQAKKLRGPIRAKYNKMKSGALLDLARERDIEVSYKTPKPELVDKLTVVEVAEKMRPAEVAPAPEVPVAEEPPLVSPPDLERRADEMKRGGYVTAPSESGIKSAASNVARWVKRKISPSRGLPKAIAAASVQKKRGIEAAGLAGRAAKADFVGARQALTAAHGREAVQGALEGVLYGDLSMEDFQAQFNLDETNPVVQVLQAFHEERVQTGQQLATLLRRVGNEDLAQKIEDNEYYVHRFYLKHAMGEDFTPAQEDYDAAVDTVAAQLSEAVDTLGGRLAKAQGKRIPVNIADYLESRDPALLEPLSKTRRAMFESAARQYDRLKRVISGVEMRDGTIQVQSDPEAIVDSAKAYVEYYLNRGVAEGREGAEAPIGALQHRALAGVFRKLYGEVRDPVYAAARTVEVQKSLVAHFTFLDSIAEGGEGTVWANMMSKKDRFTKQLPSNKKRYGLLAGKYVTPELYDAMTGTGDQVAKSYRTWMNLVGTQRFLKLMGPKTIARNYATALYGFALGCGDAARKTYGPNLKRGHKLAVGFARGDPEATREVEELVRKGVFQLYGDTQLADVREIMTLDPAKLAGRAVSKAGELYALIDFPTKVAAYWTALDRGLSDAEAVEHVHRFYQNPDRVAPAVKDIMRHPLGTLLTDYPGYFYDSVRIRGNQIRYAVESAGKGDFVPPVGLVISGALSAAIYRGFGKTGRKIWRWTRRALAKRDPETKTDEMTEPRESAFREFLPTYYKNTPLIAWTEVGKDKKQEIVYSVLGGNTAFPLEDMIYGAIQASRGRPEEFASRFGQSLRQDLVDGSMQLEGLYQLATGDSLAGTYRTDGIIDVVGRKDPRTAQIVRDSVIRYVTDTWGGQVGRKFQQSWALQEREAVDQEPTAGSYSPYRSHEAIWGSMFDPARTYRVGKTEAMRAIRDRFKPYNHGLAVAKGMVSYPAQVAAREGAPTRAQAAGAERGQMSRREYLVEMQKIAQDAKSAFAGVVTPDEISAAMRDGAKRLSKDEATAIMSGKVHELDEYRPAVRKNYWQRLLAPAQRKKPAGYKPYEPYKAY